MTVPNEFAQDRVREARREGRNATMTVPMEFARDRLLDTRQAAELFGFSIPHFRRLYRAGRVPKPIKIGERKLGWPAGVLTDFLAAPERAV